jgi:hypothetical protein
MKTELFIKRAANGWIVGPPCEPNCVLNFAEVFVYKDYPDLFRGITELTRPDAGADIAQESEGIPF